jgi:hypothetical protein
MHQRGSVVECLLDVEDRRKRLVVDLDELRRVLRQRAALGDDDGYRIPLVARLADRERKVRRHLDVFGDGPGAGKASRPVVGEVRAGERRHEALRRASAIEVDALDPRVRVWAADDGHIDHARQ